MIFVYILMGEYDLATLIEVADDATAARLTLSIAMLGDIRTQTMQAFTEDELRSIIGGLP